MISVSSGIDGILQTAIGNICVEFFILSCHNKKNTLEGYLGLGSTHKSLGLVVLMEIVYPICKWNCYAIDLK